MGKVVIYQVFTRLFGNRNLSRKENGTIAENGCGKLADFTPSVLKDIASMGVSHVWYTGVIRHATQTDYTSYGIPRQHAAVVKGKAVLRGLLGNMQLQQHVDDPPALGGLLVNLLQ